MDLSPGSLILKQRLLFLKYFMCMSTLPACMSVACVQAWCLQWSDKNTGSPASRVTDGCHVIAGN